ncbi:hypothetical protein F5148DRAFT_1252738 [Russula earlei]|uniref:Uncharacterized protein n=1 Tax=Russula earlei TaxID=71964 RepID=A0ACC0TTF4_9AGAM|nr:hypothetical protein F5148DRAFT_1252738 [Russula earlei]
MGSDSETPLQVRQGRPIHSLLFFNCASRSSSNTSSTESTTPLGSAFGTSFFQSPIQKPHLDMYASPPPLIHSQNLQKLSPALAASPHLFTPPVPIRGTLTPGLSPIDRSPRPPRPLHILTHAPPRRPFLEKLLNVTDDSDDDGFASENDDDESSPPPTPIHLGCTSTPLRATPRPSISPFSSPLSASSSLDVPLSCSSTPHRREPSPIRERSGPRISALAVTLKRPTAVSAPTHCRNKRLKATASESSPSPSVPPLRTFPASIPIHPEFPGFYIRFPVIPPVVKAAPGCTVNPPRDVFDLYTPRLVRGSGHTKVGLCPLCACTGMGKVWLSMKFSAYNYHMQYFHGIAASTARPFSPPTAFRTTPRQRPGKLERTQMLEGRCHRCSRWVPVQGVKAADAKVKELFWWKHAATCHGTSTIPGERNISLTDPAI